MLSQSYAFTQFQTNFSEKTSINQIISLIQDNSNFDLVVDFKTLPLDFSWSARFDQLTGSGKIMLFPKVFINGELYEASGWHDMAFPLDGLSGLESALMKSLREALLTMGRRTRPQA